MNRIRLAYVGAALSGRHSSLNSILLGANLPTVVDNRSVEFVLDLDGTAIAVEAFVSSRRSRCVYSDVDDPRLPEQWDDEIVRLSLCDGVIFVADAQEARLTANREAFEALRRDCAQRGVDPATLAMVVQVNKADTATAVPPERVYATAGLASQPFVSTVASRGIGCREALVLLVRAFHQVRDSR